MLKPPFSFFNLFFRRAVKNTTLTPPRRFCFLTFVCLRACSTRGTAAPWFSHQLYLYIYLTLFLACRPRGNLFVSSPRAPPIINLTIGGEEMRPRTILFDCRACGYNTSPYSGINDSSTPLSNKRANKNSFLSQTVTLFVDFHSLDLF